MSKQNDLLNQKALEIMRGYINPRFIKYIENNNNIFTSRSSIEYSALIYWDIVSETGLRQRKAITILGEKSLTKYFMYVGLKEVECNEEEMLRILILKIFQ
jgi:hypothetical protein